MILRFDVNISVGNTRAEARWSEPTQLNGVLQRYLLYVSVNVSSVGELVYNNSDFFTDYVIPDLEAGTQYFIRVGVSGVLYTVDHFFNLYKYFHDSMIQHFVTDCEWPIFVLISFSSQLSKNK